MREWERCSLCSNTMQSGGHQCCRKCVLEHNWLLINFGWFPERKKSA